ncbi:hypothetical protein Tco_0661890 [Tanacetum coccineum]
MSDEQALHPITDQSASSTVKIEAPQKLPKASLVNTSLKNLKYHLGQFDNVVKKHITANALREGEWGFEHTKVVFQNEIISFLKNLKDIFNVFDKDLLNKLTYKLSADTQNGHQNFVCVTSSDLLACTTQTSCPTSLKASGVEKLGSDCGKESLEHVTTLMFLKDTHSFVHEM